MATPSSVFTEMVTTTDRHWVKGVADNVSDHNGLFNRLKKKGQIESISGGYEIVERLDYAENSTYQRYSGYDSLNTAASDVLTSAKFDLKQAAVHVTASGREIRMNSGKEAMVKLVAARKKNAMRTAANNMSVDIYSDGTLSNQIGGLSNLIQTAGTGTVGGIDSSTFTFWQNQAKEMTGTNLAASPSAANAVSMKADMNDLWLNTTRGADKTDLIIFSNDLFALFELGEQQLQRYASAEMADAGFIGYKYKTADVIHDNNTNFGSTAELGYFLNTDYLKLVQHSEAKWTMDESKTPVNQDSVVIPAYWMGNMTVSNRARQGVLFDAA